MSVCYLLFFFFNDTATTEIYTLSLHDALPILRMARSTASCRLGCPDPKPTSDSPLASTTPLDVTCLTARQAKYSDVSSAKTGCRCVATLGVNDCSGSASRVWTRKPPSSRL